MKLAWVGGVSGGVAGRLVLLLGLGLIGRCIHQSLAGLVGSSFEEFPFDWNDAEARNVQIASLLDKILDRAESTVGAVDIVWSAGRAGFGAGAEELSREDAPFDDVLSLASTLAERLPRAVHRFHMMSSAGGLYEGQRLVDHGSETHPLRPYGRAKLAQEMRGGHLPAPISCSIYRPSSVYGYNGHGGRAGLITVLIDNARMHRTSHIFGDLNTLRDYVLASDIGAFVATRVLAERIEPGIFLLASGKPAAIAEVLRIVERVEDRRLYVRFERQASNADHMSFVPSALPANWWPTDLDTGIRLTARQLRGSVQVA